MAKRTAKKGTRPAPLSADRLRSGWPGPAGTRIQLARAQDTNAVDALLTMAGVQLIPALRSAVETATAASVLLAGLGGTTNTFFHTAALSFVTKPMAESMSGISLMLVAVDQEDQVVGVLSVTAPGTIIEKAMEHGYEPPKALTMGIAVAKIHGLAVAEQARGQGIAAALLKRAWQVYEQLGFLLPPLDIPFGIHAGPNECVFTRWRPRR